MKTRILLLSALCLAAAVPAAPIGTAFTYQGYLSVSGGPANGNYDLQFTLFDAANNGNQIGLPLTNLNVTVNNGLFLVPLDFGPVFDGNARWLALGVRTNGNPAGSFAALLPLQPLSPTPYALYATNAGASGNVAAGTVSASQLSTPAGGPTTGQVLAFNGGNLVWTNAAAANGSGWALTGNAGASPAADFLGTTDDNALAFRVNNIQGWQLTPTADAPNVVAGAPGNFVAAGMQGATIGGGGTIATYGKAYSNSIFSFHGTIGGGLGNTIQTNSNEATIAGGRQNTIQSAAGDSVIVGGIENTLETSALYSCIVGGFDNSIQGGNSFIGCGYQNVIETNANFDAIGGGYGNHVDANSTWCAVGGGYYNTIQTNIWYSFIGGGKDNSTGSSNSFIGGGITNSINPTSPYSAIAGGNGNQVIDDAAAASITGGMQNVAYGQYATIAGGISNYAAANCFAAGTLANAQGQGDFVWSDSSASTSALFANEFVARASGGFFFYSSPNSSAGAELAAGATSWTALSDRHAKKNIAPVNYEAVLDKLAKVPISQWNYNWEKDTDVPNIGPMAQDFIGAFYPGRNDKGITTLEFDGVELAAIEGLNQKLQAQDQKLQATLKEKDAKIAQLQKDLADLKSAQRQTAADWNNRFDALQKIVARINDKSGAALVAASSASGQ